MRKPKTDFSQLFPELTLSSKENFHTLKPSKKGGDDDIAEAKRKHVKEYYPIYSDQEGAWQADLMFMNYTTKANQSRRHTFFCLINIHTKYAFVRQLIFNRPKDEDDLWKAGTKRTPGTSTASLKTAKNCMKALKDIFEKDMPHEEEWLRSPNGGGAPRAEFFLNVIYTDEGYEFKGEFDRWCRENEIRHVVFKPGEGKKTRLGIVERFNRTLRRYYALWKHNHPGQNHYFPNALPKVLEAYNRQVDHQSIRRFYKHLAKGEKLPDGAIFTPALMMKQPAREKQWVQWKKGREKKVDKDWSEDIVKLKGKPKVRFFKNVLDKKNQFQKSGGGNLSKAVQVLGPNQYAHKKMGKSWVLDTEPEKGSGYLKLMPYDLLIR
jgi:hypothetical protein